MVRELKTPHTDFTIAKVANNTATDYEMLLFEERFKQRDDRFRKTVRDAEKYYNQQAPGREVEGERLSAAIRRISSPQNGQLPPRGDRLLAIDEPPRTAHYPFNQSDIQIEEVKVYGGGHGQGPKERWFRRRVEGGPWERCDDPAQFSPPNPAGRVPASRAAGARHASPGGRGSPAGVTGTHEPVSPRRRVPAVLSRFATSNAAARRRVESPTGGAGRGDGGHRDTNRATAASATRGLSKCFGSLAVEASEEQHRSNPNRAATPNQDPGTADDSLRGRAGRGASRAATVRDEAGRREGRRRETACRIS